MNTHVWGIGEAAFQEALELLQAGQAVVFPTDTVYGVGADGLNPAAVLRLYQIKERPYSQAIPLLIGDSADVAQVASAVPPVAQRLIKRFWPGALTLVVPAAAHLPAELLAGGATVAVRLPDHAFVRRLCRELGRPLAATSANRHGGPNPTTIDDVLRQLGGRTPLFIDGGATPGDIPSTIIDLSGSEPRVLRSGAIPPEVLAEVLGRV